MLTANFTLRLALSSVHPYTQVYELEISSTTSMRKLKLPRYFLTNRCLIPQEHEAIEYTGSYCKICGSDIT